MAKQNQILTQVLMEISANSAQLKRGLDEANKHVSGFKKGVAKVGNLIKGAFAATAVIASTTGAATTDITVSGSANFTCPGLKSGESVVFMSADSAGNYEPITYINGGGQLERAELGRGRSIIRINGPLDIRVVKSATKEAKEVTQHT